MAISIKVLLFASAREAAGNVAEVTISLENNDDSNAPPNTTNFRYERNKFHLFIKRNITFAIYTNLSEHQTLCAS